MIEDKIRSKVYKRRRWDNNTQLNKGLNELEIQVEDITKHIVEDLKMLDAEGNLKLEITKNEININIEDFKTEVSEDSKKLQEEINAANAKAEEALAGLGNVSLDNKITVEEKPIVLGEFDEIKEDYLNVLSVSEETETPCIDVTIAYEKLSNYLEPILSDMTVPTSISSIEFDFNFENYFNARASFMESVLSKEIVNSEIRTEAKIKVSAEEISTEMKKEITTVDQKFTSEISSIKQTADSITQRVESTEVVVGGLAEELEQVPGKIDSEIEGFKNGYLQDNFAQIKVESDRISQTVSETKTYLDQKIEANTSLINQTADSILLEVKSTTDKIEGDVSNTGTLLDSIKNDLQNQIVETNTQAVIDKNKLLADIENARAEAAEGVGGVSSSLEQLDSKVENNKNQSIIDIENKFNEAIDEATLLADQAREAALSSAMADSQLKAAEAERLAKEEAARLADEAKAQAEAKALLAQQAAEAAQASANSAQNSANNANAGVSQAQADANKANQVLVDMSSDSMVTPQEKVDLKREYSLLCESVIKVKESALSYGVPTSTLDSKLNELDLYLTNDVKLQINETTAIVIATFDTKWKSAYDERQNVINAINDTIQANAETLSAEAERLAKEHAEAEAEKKRLEAESNAALDAKNKADNAFNNAVSEAELLAKEAEKLAKEYAKTEADIASAAAKVAQIAADKAINDASEAQRVADNAQLGVNTAQADADRANAVLGDMSADNKITPQEKADLKREYTQLSDSVGQVITNASVFGITNTLSAKLSDLNTYLVNTVGINNTTTTATVDTAMFNGKWKAVYDERQRVVNEINNKIQSNAQTLSEAAEVASKQYADIKKNEAITAADTAAKATAEAARLLAEQNSAVDAFNKAEAARIAAELKAKEALDAAKVAQDIADNATGGVLEAKEQARLANNLLADMSSDGKITPAEKIGARKELSELSSSVAKVKLEAGKYSVSSTTMDTKLSELNTYLLNIAKINLDEVTAVVASEYNSKWKNSYDSRQDVVDAINAKIQANAQAMANDAESKAKTHAEAKASEAEAEAIRLAALDATTKANEAERLAKIEAEKAKEEASRAQIAADKAISDAATAQSTANKAQNDATKAQESADSAKTSATTANNLLSDISNDNKLTPSEKQSAKKEWDAISGERQGILDEATRFSVSSANYTTSYNNLNTYISPLLTSLTTTSNITGTEFRSKFNSYYTERQKLLNAISAKAKTLADNAQTAAGNAQSTANSANTTANSAQSGVNTLTPKVNVLESWKTTASETIAKLEVTSNSISQRVESAEATIEENRIEIEAIPGVIDGKIDTFKTTVFEEKVSELVTDLDGIRGTVSSNTSKLEEIPAIIDGQIETLKQGYIEDKMAQINITTDSITQTVSYNKQTTDGEITALDSKIEQTAGQISQTITNVNTDLSGKIEANTSLINQTANSIRLEVSSGMSELEGEIVSNVDLINSVRDQLKGEITSSQQEAIDSALQNATIIGQQAESNAKLEAERLASEKAEEARVSAETASQAFAEAKRVEAEQNSAIDAFNKAEAARISAEAKALEAKQAADAAQASADTANSGVAQANSQAQQAVTRLNEMAADDKITAQEKVDVRKELQELKDSVAKVKESASKPDFVVSTTNLDTKLSTLNTYLTNTVQISSNTTTTITPATYTANWKAVYDERQDVINKINDKIQLNAKNLSAAAQSAAQTHANNVSASAEAEAVKKAALDAKAKADEAQRLAEAEAKRLSDIAKAAADAAQSTANNVQSDLNNNIKPEITNIKSEVSSLTVETNAIIGRVESAELYMETIPAIVDGQIEDFKTGYVEDKYAELKIETDRITTTVGETTNYLDGKIESNTAQIIQTSDKISQTVSDLTQIGEKVTGIQSDITQLSSDINLQIATVTESVDNKTTSEHILSQINLSTDGVKIKGEKIRLDGDTEVFGSFKVGGVNILDGTITSNNISASGIVADKITSGVLDASKITVTNLQVGSISGFDNAVSDITDDKISGLDSVFDKINEDISGVNSRVTSIFSDGVVNQTEKRALKTEVERLRVEKEILSEVCKSLEIEDSFTEQGTTYDLELDFYEMNHFLSNIIKDVSEETPVNRSELKTKMDQYLHCYKELNKKCSDKNKEIKDGLINDFNDLNETVTNTDVRLNEIIFAHSYTNGKILYNDPNFVNGNNSIGVYNNSGNGHISHSLKDSWGPTKPNALQGSRILVIARTGATTNPNYGGFHFATATSANRIFITKIIACFPVGKKINFHTNATGNEGTHYWTKQEGTGKWEEYICVVKCGSSGNFSSTNFFALSGGSSTELFEWGVAFATVYDMGISEAAQINQDIKNGKIVLTDDTVVRGDLEVKGVGNRIIVDGTNGTTNGKKLILESGSISFTEDGVPTTVIRNMASGSLTITNGKATRRFPNFKNINNVEIFPIMRQMITTGSFRGIECYCRVTNAVEKEVEFIMSEVLVNPIQPTQTLLASNVSSYERNCARLLLEQVNLTSSELTLEDLSIYGHQITSAVVTSEIVLKYSFFTDAGDGTGPKMIKEINTNITPKITTQYTEEGTSLNFSRLLVKSTAFTNRVIKTPDIELPMGVKTNKKIYYTCRVINDGVITLKYIRKALNTTYGSEITKVVNVFANPNQLSAQMLVAYVDEPYESSPMDGEVYYSIYDK